MKRAPLLLLGLLGALGTACTTARWSAVNSVHPVLLGPVQRIGAASGAASRDELGPFASTCETQTAAASGGGTTFGNASQAAPTMADWHVAEAAGADLERLIAVRSFECSGYGFFLPFPAIILSRAECSAAGGVFKIPRRAGAGLTSVAAGSAGASGKPATEPAVLAPRPAREALPPPPPPPRGF